MEILTEFEEQIKFFVIEYHSTFQKHFSLLPVVQAFSNINYHLWMLI